MIKKRDISNLINRLADRYGYLDKETFLSAVTALEEVEPNKPIIKNADILRGNIIRYQKRVSIKGEKGYFTKYIERIYKLTGKHEILAQTRSNREARLSDKNAVILAKDLCEILSVTKPTFTRLQKLGIIEQLPGGLDNLIIDGQEVELNRCRWLNYYDLDRLKDNLSCYIKSKRSKK